ncbi:cyanase [Reinekea blandensis]|uniref:Cyanate hydratase n=1 Tax=Reinekea blandensis MED297 TaxID=314283 RepID=A4BAX9_9GAMM|nr:cyanase [Reinekea blandensis]EAR10592.1 cyanate lyase [Reinekea sp. MED297] [Reinekea blandensis MED297]
MNKIQMTETIINAKLSKAVSWESLAAEVGLDPVFLTSACLGMNSLKAEAAESLCRLLELPDSIATQLQQCPLKQWDQAVPTDPLIYRLYEIVGVYGGTIKELIHEKFGDGIMSAIDFSMNIEKEENPAGDRVKVTMNGKFLPYKSW